MPHRLSTLVQVSSEEDLRAIPVFLVMEPKVMLLGETEFPARLETSIFLQSIRLHLTWHLASDLNTLAPDQT